MADFNFLFGLLETESLSELSIMIEIIRKGVDPSWSTMKPHSEIYFVFLSVIYVVTTSFVCNIQR